MELVSLNIPGYSGTSVVRARHGSRGQGDGYVLFSAPVTDTAAPSGASFIGC